jgi:hypothetical protein
MWRSGRNSNTKGHTDWDLRKPVQRSSDSLEAAHGNRDRFKPDNPWPKAYLALARLILLARSLTGSSVFAAALTAAA